MPGWIGTRLIGNRVVVLSLLIVYPAMAGCAFAQAQRSGLSISVIQDSVRFRRSAEGDEMRAAVVLRNNTGRAIYYSAGCGPTLQRQVERSWRRVWDNQLCVGGVSDPIRITPGDSVVQSAHFLGFTTHHPAVDHRVVVPGRFRLVVADVGFEVHPTTRQIRRGVAEEARSSASFVVQPDQ